MSLPPNTIHPAPPIIGYRDLTEAEIQLVNQLKMMAQQVGVMVKATWEIDGVDERWVRLGTDNIQTGFMQVIRGITKPESF